MSQLWWFELKIYKNKFCRDLHDLQILFRFTYYIREKCTKKQKKVFCLLTMNKIFKRRKIGWDFLVFYYNIVFMFYAFFCEPKCLFLKSSMTYLITKYLPAISSQEVKPLGSVPQERFSWAPQEPNASLFVFCRYILETLLPW